MAMNQSNNQAERLKVPGFGLPLGWLPEELDRFPVALGIKGGCWAAATLLIREVCMLMLMEELTNKPNWWDKVRDPEIAAKWKKEALEVDWAAVRNYADFTPAMADACIEELRVKADIYEQTGLIPVMDYSIAAIKSDKLIPDDLYAALNKAVAQLEDIPDNRKDWHPNTDEKVLDLVHPSLWPFVYGRSRVLADKRIGLDDCISHCGLGEIIPVTVLPARTQWSNNTGEETLSTKFQWLPCDVTIDGQGHAKIDSYINNLHPVEHATLYPIIEQFIQRSLPAWDIVYRWPRDLETQRLTVSKVDHECETPDLCDYDCTPTKRPVDEDEAPRQEDEAWQDGYEQSERGKRDAAWFAQTHSMKLPDPELACQLAFEASDVRSSGFFDVDEGESSRIQVIVKLANIHLTPDKPSYDGGSWHVEGQLNEHICATALFYYDADNITDCHLSLRAPADAENLSTTLDYNQNDDYSIEHTYAVEVERGTIQDIGSILTRQGRALFFPNLYQHRVSPFRLADPSRPGHRKILALFLVDPAIPILSTANVPPQQKHWWQAAAGLSVRGESLGGVARLPPELTEMVLQNVDFPFGEDEAKRLRGELMEERTAMQDGQVNTCVEWNFCEH